MSDSSSDVEVVYKKGDTQGVSEQGQEGQVKSDSAESTVPKQSEATTATDIQDNPKSLGSEESQNDVPPTTPEKVEVKEPIKVEEPQQNVESSPSESTAGAGISVSPLILSPDDNISEAGLSDTFTDDEEGVTESQGTIKSLLAYFQSLSTEPISVKISPSGAKRKMMRLSKTVVYQLEVKIGDTGTVVWREYDEFVLLSKYLGSRMKGAIIPPLPPPFPVIGSVTEIMLGKRLRNLQEFMNATIRHPFLRKDTVLLNFLRSVEPFQKKTVDTIKWGTSEGQNQWHEMISVVRPPSRPLLLIKLAQEEMSILSSFYTSLLKEIKTVSTKLVNYAATLKHFSSSFESWKNIERSDLRILSGIASFGNETLAPQNVPFSSFVETIERTISEDHDHIILQSKEIMYLMKPVLKYELMIIESYLKDMEKVKDSLAKYKKASKHLRSLEVEELRQKPDVGEDDRSPGVSSAMSKKLESARQQKAEAKREADYYTKGTLSIELNRYRFERASRASSMLSKLSEFKASISQSEFNKWNDSLKKLPQVTLPEGSEIALLQELMNSKTEAKSG